MGLKEELLKNTTIKETALLEDSEAFKDNDRIPTPVPMINVGLSADLDGGLGSGHTMIAGPSKHFKTNFMLLIAASFIKKHPDGVILFYDNEFGSPASYVESFGIPPESIVHTPILSIEELKHDIMTQLAGIEKGDKLLIMIDSIGNAASEKEIVDTIKGESKADFTRAKQLKSLFRQVTPVLRLKRIPLITINHTYMTMETYSKPVVSGGTGAVYSADTIWVVGRQQEKDDDGLAGFNFVINIEKSRFVREKTKFHIRVTFENGVDKWSGIFDAAMEAGIITKPKVGWYALQRELCDGDSTKLWRRADLETPENMKKIVEYKPFKDWIKANYTIVASKKLQEDDFDEQQE